MLDAAALFAVHHVEPGKGLFGVLRAVERRLHLVDVGLQFVQVLFDLHLALGQDAYGVADALHLLQVVGAHEHGHLPFRHVVHHVFPYLLADDGVETVDGFVQDEKIRPAAHGEDELRLFLHTFGELGDLAPFGQSEVLQHHFVPDVVPVGIDALVEIPHAL